MIRKRQLKRIAWGFLYWIIMIISYSWALQHHFSNDFLFRFDVLNFLISSFTLLGLLFFVPQTDDLAAFFITVLLFFVIIPMAVIYVCYPGNSVFFLSTAVCFALLELGVGKIRVSPRTLKIKGIKNPEQFIIWLSYFLIGTTLVLLYIQRGLPNLSSLNISLVYEIRSSYSLSSAASILYSISSHALIPFLVAVYFCRKEYKKVFIPLAIQFLFFLWLANKTTLFSLVVLLAGFFLGRSRHGELLFSKYMTGGVALVTILEGNNETLRKGLSMGIYTAYSVVIRRAFFVPAVLKQLYYDYFVLKGNPLAGFFGTVFAPILTRLDVANPYQSIPYPRVIGMTYLGSTTYANTGAFGRELAHFGIAGPMVAAFSLLLFLLCVKVSEKTSGRVFTCCLSIYTVISFADRGAMELFAWSPVLIVALIMRLFNFEAYNAEKDAQLEVQAEE